MIPIRDENPTSRRAVITPILIGLNVVVFLFIQPTFAGGGSNERARQQTEFFVCNAAIPYEVTRGDNLHESVEQGDIQAGPQDRQLLAECADKRPWLAILWSMFFHGGFLHIASNMLYLFIFGNNVEDRLGRVRFTLFYLLSGVAATLAHVYLNGDSLVPLVGASGAIAGVLGAYLLLFPHARIYTVVIFFFITVIRIPAIVVLGFWFVLQVFQGVGDVSPTGGGVAYMAHVGGFVAGMALLAVFRPRGRPPAQRQIDWPY